MKEKGGENSGAHKEWSSLRWSKNYSREWVKDLKIFQGV
jgi:hypothetical protein